MIVPKLKIAHLALKCYLRQLCGRQVVLNYQESQFRKLIYYAYDKSLFYKELYSSHGIKRRDLKDINYHDLPIVSKDILVDNMDSVFTNKNINIDRLEKWLKNHPDPSDTYYKKFLVLRTSGSSNKILYSVYSLNEIFYTIACFVSRVYYPKPGKLKIAFIGATDGHYTGVTMAEMGKYLGYAKNTRVFSLLDTNDKIMQGLNEFEPTRIVAYGNFYNDLIKASREGKLKITPEHMAFSGDGITEEIGKQIYNLWGIHPINHYISTETLLVGTCTDGTGVLDVYDDYIKLEIYDPETKQSLGSGESGNLLVTNLHNFTTPIIRYKMDDIASIQPRKESVFSKLKLAKFRTFVSPIILNNDGNEDTINFSTIGVFFVPKLLKYQFNFVSKNKVIIKYIADRNIDKSVEDEFKRILTKKNAEKSVKFKVEKVNKIETEANGKTSVVKILY